MSRRFNYAAWARSMAGSLILSDIQTMHIDREDFSEAPDPEKAKAALERLGRKLQATKWEQSPQGEKP